jgi:hypothetical protein
MTLIPKETPAEVWMKIELNDWIYYPEEFKDHVVDSLDELKELLVEKYGPDFGLYDIVQKDRKENEDFVRYHGLTKGALGTDLAYGCDFCEKIIIGPPRMELRDDVDVLSGSQGLEYHCTNCNELIRKKTFKQYLD